MYRYEDFDEYKMISTIRNKGVLEICLSKNESKVFDYMISRYSNKGASEAQAYDGLLMSFNFFASLGTVYKMWFIHRKLCCFDNVFSSQKPIEFMRGENGEDIIYTCKKVLKAASSVQ